MIRNILAVIVFAIGLFLYWFSTELFMDARVPFGIVVGIMGAGIAGILAGAGSLVWTFLTRKGH